MKTSSTVNNPDFAATANRVKQILKHTILELDKVDITVLGYSESFELENLYNDIQKRINQIPTVE